jgi:hypothetical protein
VTYAIVLPGDDGVSQFFFLERDTGVITIRRPLTGTPVVNGQQKNVYDVRQSHFLFLFFLLNIFSQAVCPSDTLYVCGLHYIFFFLFGVDQFSVRASDGRGNNGTASVRITINRVAADQRPFFVNTPYTTIFDIYQPVPSDRITVSCRDQDIPDSQVSPISFLSCCLHILLHGVFYSIVFLSCFVCFLMYCFSL